MNNNKPAEDYINEKTQNHTGIIDNLNLSANETKPEIYTLRSTKSYSEINELDVESDSTLYIENHPDHVKAIFVCVGIISLVSSSIAIIALRRTKRIPHAAKFLSTGLLTFDSLYITSITVRKFVQEPLYNTSLQVLSTSVLQLAYVTVGLMSLERFIMFHKPMNYMKTCTERLLRTSAFVLWTLTVTIFQSVRYGVCFLKLKSLEMVFEQAGKCNQIVTIYYSSLVIMVLVTSMVCYWNIFSIVKSQLTISAKKTASFSSTANVLRGYKSTSLVLIYLFVVLCTSVTYALIIFFIRYFNLGVDGLRLALEIISIINCILDPFLYVLWFKESRMEVCKLFSVFSKRLEKKVERMKYEIFDIVTASSAYSYTSTDGS